MTIIDRDREQAAPPNSGLEDRPHRSVSQLNTFTRCPKCYQLQRIDQVPQRPDAWSAEGIAVHAAIEALELSRRQMSLEAMQEEFVRVYDWEISQRLEGTANLDYWAKSGPYTAIEDIPRRRALGLEICAKYFAWCQANPGQVPVEIDGGPGVEIELRFDLGGVPILAYVDHVREVPGKGPRVGDVKTGKLPGEHIQLGVYRIGLMLARGIETEPVGDYWNGKTGRLSRPKDLSAYTAEHLTDVFGQLDEDITAERFDPRPDPQTCRSCSVNAWCDAREI